MKTFNQNDIDDKYEFLKIYLNFDNLIILRKY